MEKVYDFYSDAGHGWLRVPKKELVELKIADKISEYSYINGASIYLEEDSDLTIFMEAYKKKNGTLPELREHNTDNDSIIRTYQHYRG